MRRRLRDALLRYARHHVPVVAAIGWLSAAAEMAFAQTPDTSLWVTDAPVHAMASAGGTLYIGGEFTHVGPPTGSFVRLDAATGAVLPPMNRVAGDVSSVAPDGSGGWYLAGTFQFVQGQPRDGLAHIDASGALTDWDPDVSGRVEILVVSEGTLYAAGFFTQIGGQPRSHMAAFDAATGTLTAWNPNPDQGVYAIAVDEGTVYASGKFTSMGGQPRNRMAAVDAVTGAVTAWNPNPDDVSVALNVHQGRVYAGGFFSNIGGRPRSRIAALDRNTGAATDWNPNATAPVLCLAASGGTIYAGGLDWIIGGQERHHIAALDTVSGAATSWNPNASGAVYCLIVSGGRIYAGGSFMNIGGQPRRSLAELDPVTGNATTWDPIVNGAVLTLASDGASIAAGGTFASVGGVLRNRIAALDAVTGAATSWNPNASGNSGFYQEPTTVYALAVNGATVYAGGRFANIGGQERNAIAALDAATGVATSWNPDIHGDVYDLRVANGSVHVGGEFISIGGQERICIGAIDAVSGGPTGWNPGADNTVYTLAIDGSTVYAGGAFENIGGQARSGVAALDFTTGLATSWNPDFANPGIHEIVPHGGMVYVAGYWSSAQGPGIAAVDAASGSVTSWNPHSDQFAYALAVDGNSIYVGGTFSAIGGQSRLHLAGVDLATGLATSWNPGLSSTWGSIQQFGVMTLDVIGPHLYVGGDFRTFGGWPVSGLVRFLRPSVLGAPIPSFDEPLQLAVSPNPLSRRSTLSFTLAEPADVEVCIHDVAGRRVNTLVRGRFEGGAHRLVWNGRDREGRELPPGIYLATLSSGTKRAVTKLMKLR